MDISTNEKGSLSPSLSQADAVPQQGFLEIALRHRWIILSATVAREKESGPWEIVSVPSQALFSLLRGYQRRETLQVRLAGFSAFTGFILSAT